MTAQNKTGRPWSTKMSEEEYIRSIHLICTRDESGELQELWSDLVEWAEIFRQEAITELAGMHARGEEPSPSEMKMYAFIQQQFHGAERRLRKALWEKRAPGDERAQRLYASAVLKAARKDEE